MELDPKLYKKIDITKEIELIAFFEDKYQPLDYNMREGTSTSYVLEILHQHELKPIGITYYIGEETFIFKTKEDAKRGGWKILRPHGWWYSLSQWNNIVEKADSLIKKEYITHVYWLDKNYAPKIRDYD